MVIIQLLINVRLKLCKIKSVLIKLASYRMKGYNTVRDVVLHLQHVASLYSRVHYLVDERTDQLCLKDVPQWNPVEEPEQAGSKLNNTGTNLVGKGRSPHSDLSLVGVELAHHL